MTDTELDRIYEMAVTQDWEEQTEPERESIRTAVEAAVDLLMKAHETLAGSVDEHSRAFDRVISFCNDIEDIANELNAERW